MKPAACDEVCCCCLLALAVWLAVAFRLIDSGSCQGAINCMSDMVFNWRENRRDAEWM